jgi:hypothetical protein
MARKKKQHSMESTITLELHYHSCTSTVLFPYKAIAQLTGALFQRYHILLRWYSNLLKSNFDQNKGYFQLIVVFLSLKYLFE